MGLCERRTWDCSEAPSASSQEPRTALSPLLQSFLSHRVCLYLEPNSLYQASAQRLTSPRPALGVPRGSKLYLYRLGGGKCPICTPAVLGTWLIDIKVCVLKVYLRLSLHRVGRDRKCGSETHRCLSQGVGKGLPTPGFDYLLTHMYLSE